MWPSLAQQLTSEDGRIYFALAAFVNRIDLIQTGLRLTGWLRFPIK
jgi:hypothetical protein